MQLEDEPRDGIQIGRECLATEAHRLEWDRASTSEGIEDAGGAVAEGIANPFAEALDLKAVLAAPVENAPCRLLEVRVLTASFELFRDQTTGHALAQAAALFGVAGIREQGRQQHRATSASGLRAGQMWSVEMWPWRTLFSWTESREICRRGMVVSERRVIAR